MHYTFLLTFGAVALVLWIVMAFAAVHEANARKARRRAIEAAKLSQQSIVPSQAVSTPGPGVRGLPTKWRPEEKDFVVWVDANVLRFAGNAVPRLGPQVEEIFFASYVDSTSILNTNPMTTQVEVQRLWADVLPTLRSRVMRSRGIA